MDAGQGPERNSVRHKRVIKRDSASIRRLIKRKRVACTLAEVRSGEESVTGEVVQTILYNVLY